MSWAKVTPEYTQFGHDINIGASDEVDEVTCFACSVRIRGHVEGDVTTFGGNVIIEDRGEVSGEVTTIGGNVQLDEASSIAGDVTVLGGQLRRPPEARIAGDITTMAGRGWLVLIFLVPLMILGAFVALVVWVIRRLFRPVAPAVAA
jgi:hypothetical protein